MRKKYLRVNKITDFWTVSKILLNSEVLEMNGTTQNAKLHLLRKTLIVGIDVGKWKPIMGGLTGAITSTKEAVCIQ